MTQKSLQKIPRFAVLLILSVFLSLAMGMLTASHAQSDSDHQQNELQKEGTQNAASGDYGTGAEKTNTGDDDDNDDGVNQLPNPKEPSCAQIGLNDDIPEGFGSPYSFLDGIIVGAQKAVRLLTADCIPTAVGGQSMQYEVKIESGSGNIDEFIYTKGYYSEANAWKPYTLECANGADPLEGKWCRSKAKTTLSNLSLDNPRYLLSYVCRWGNGAWLCGCRDQACTEKYWTIQKLRP